MHVPKYGVVRGKNTRISRENSPRRTLSGAHFDDADTLVRARGTRDIQPQSRPLEPPLGDAWLWSLWSEQLARNIATAAGHELAYRMGLADGEIRALRRLDDLRKLRDA